MKRAKQSAQARVVARLEDGFARICQIYGLRPQLGRIYARLFLATEPLSLGEISGAIGAAKSSTSVSLRMLERLRLVSRRPRGSDRRDYYEAVLDPQRIVSEWLRLFVLPELSVGTEAAGSLRDALNSPDVAAELPGDSLAELRRRAELLQTWIDTTRQLIEGFSTAMSAEKKEDTP